MSVCLRLYVNLSFVYKCRKRSSLGEKGREKARSKKKNPAGEKEGMGMRKMRYKSCKPCHVGSVPAEEVVSSKSEDIRLEAATSEPKRDDGTSVTVDGLHEHLVDIA